MSRTKLSDHFYLDEFTRSQTATRHCIDNSVDLGSQIFRNIESLCIDVLHPIREALGPVHITSGYRCPKLNNKIGGSPNSQHTLGLAADIRVSHYTPYEVAKFCQENLKNYDQLIHEFGQWVHISIEAPGKQPRNTAFTAVRKRKLGRLKTIYVRGILEIETAIKRA